MDECKPLVLGDPPNTAYLPIEECRAGDMAPTADSATRKRLFFSQGALRPNPETPPVGALFRCEKSPSNDPIVLKVDEVGGKARCRRFYVCEQANYCPGPQRKTSVWQSDLVIRSG